MSILHALILGIVEGITEFLPISSTGHLILTQKLLGIASDAYTKSFDISIQSGAILAVVVVYWKTLTRDLGIWKKLIVAFVPTATLGLIFYTTVKTFLLGNENVVLWSLALGGTILIVFEWFFANRKPETGSGQTVHEEMRAIPLAKAFAIGVFQAIAIIPGVSRSAATIVGGLGLGISRRTIVEFSFLLAVPTMAAATGLELVKNYHEFSGANLAPLIVGFVATFIVALVAIRFLLKYVKTHTFVAFGVYRIVLVIAWLLLFRA